MKIAQIQGFFGGSLKIRLQTESRRISVFYQTDKVILIGRIWIMEVYRLIMDIQTWTLKAHEYFIYMWLS